MKKLEDYTKALKMIDARITEFSDVFVTCDCDKIIGGKELTRRETLLMHLLDELAILNIYKDREDAGGELLADYEFTDDPAYDD